MHRTLLTLFLLGLPLSAGAGTVDILFEPPVLASSDICHQRLGDEALVARWDGVSADSLPETDPALIKRDFRRLMELDPARWFDLINDVQSRFQALDPDYSEVNMAVDRIELLLAAGRVSDLQRDRLVEKLATMDLATTPRAQHLLAGYLMRGVGIEKDEEKGEALLLGAALGGNADAILALVERDIEGNPVPGWTVPPDLGVTMAFGALVGKLDPLICDRVNRISREYMNGRIVARNPLLAERWYRFSADLGDALSAWRVAELHMWAEDVNKDNEVLVHYLNAAADAGLPYAQAALARVMADGALVPRNLDAADATFAASGRIWPPGAASHVLFLQAQSRLDPAWTPRYRDALARLVESDEAPAWALVAMAEQILRTQGRWAGEAQALALLDRAVLLGEYAALERISVMKMRRVNSPQAFYAVIDQLIEAVMTSGKVGPIQELSAAFICRAPDAPQLAEADYWNRVGDSTSSLAVDLTPQALNALAKTPDPITEAEIQTQALTGRITSIAQYIYLLEARGADDSTLAFWGDHAGRFPGVTTARASLALQAARSPAARNAALDLFREAVRRGESSAGTQLAEALLDSDHVTPEIRAEAVDLLLPLAEKGSGDAMAMLPLADPEQFPNLAAVFDRFAAAIDTHGDFDALVLALPLVSDPAVYADYLGRATAATACTFDEALRMTDAVGRAGDDTQFRRWLRITDYLAQRDGEALADLADVFSRHGTDADQPQILAYYEAAREGGSRMAVHRLLNIYARRSAPQYDPQLSAELFTDLVRFSPPDDLPAALARLRTAAPEIRAIAYREIDEAALYLTAAKSGSPVAMREYALILRNAAATPEQVLESTDWLRRAAEAGEPTAMVDLAEALVFGIGTAPSRKEAVAWLQKAADLGSEDAALRLRGLELSTEVLQ